MSFDEDLLNKALENENNESIVNLTISKIKTQKNDILQKLNLSTEKLKDNLKKLKEYRYINNINDLNYGCFIRCINLKKVHDIKLNNGGYVCDIKVNNGIELLCRNNYNNFFQIRFDENLIFQKLTEQEKIILNVLKNLD
jgi:hypothetical protein